MSRKIRQIQYKGFFSFDAAAAILIAVFAYASLSLLLSASAASASSSSSDASSRLLSLRVSSFILDEAGAQQGGFGLGAYVKSGELDLQRLGELDLHGVLTSTSRKFASVSVFSQGGEEFSSSSGEAGANGVFCASRLALLSGKMARLEVCIA